MIKLKLSSIFVDDQDKALDFYTKKLGLEIKNNISLGEYKWLTVGSADSEFEMLLEPKAHPAAKEYASAIYKDGITATILYVDDIDKEYKRLIGEGVKFLSEPADMGGVKLAVFDDTCGNLIRLCQE